MPTPWGSVPTEIVAMTVSVDSEMTETVFDPELDTYTSPLAVSTTASQGVVPTAIVVTTAGRTEGVAADDRTPEAAPSDKAVAATASPATAVILVDRSSMLLDTDGLPCGGHGPDGRDGCRHSLTRPASRVKRWGKSPRRPRLCRPSRRWPGPRQPRRRRSARWGRSPGCTSCSRCRRRTGCRCPRPDPGCRG